MRQLPTITMFKINMNLEMEGGTDALAAPVEAVAPMPREPVPIDDFDVAVIRALQGPMEVRPDAYAPAAERARRAGRAAARALPRHGRAQAAAPGRGDPLPPPRGLLRQRHGRLEGAARTEIAELGPRMAAVRGVSHCYQRPTYPRLAVQRLHDGARALEGGVRRGARRRRRGVRAGRATTARRSTPRPSSRRSACTTSRPTTPSGRRDGAASGRLPPRLARSELFERAHAS